MKLIAIDELVNEKEPNQGNETQKGFLTKLLALIDEFHPDEACFRSSIFRGKRAIHA